MKEGLVSVVLPVYHPDVSYLRACVQSILSQTYGDFEVLLVYDKSGSSTDDTSLAVLSEFADDRRFHITVNERRNGLAGSLNMALADAKGEYIARADCDDLYAENRFERQLKVLEFTRSDLVGSWARLIDRNGSEVGYVTTPSEPAQVRRLFLLGNPVIHSSVLCRSSLFRETGFYDGRYDGAEDYEFYLRCLTMGRVLRSVPEPLMSLRFWKDSVTGGSRRHFARWAATRVRAKAIMEGQLATPSDLVMAGAAAFKFILPTRMRKKLNPIKVWTRNENGRPPS